MSQLRDPLINIIREPSLTAQLTPAQWNLALCQAEAAQLMGVLADMYLPDPSVLPEVARERLSWAQQLVLHQQRSVEMALQHLIDALGDYSPMLLKGAAYQVAQTPNAAGRMMSDIDILIPQRFLKQAERSLWLHGWDNRGKTPYDEKYYRLWMHELPPFVHQKTGVVLDLHHHWLPNTCRWQFDIGQVYQNAYQASSLDMLLPDPCDLCLHAAAHLLTSGEGDKGWRDLRDVYLLSQQVSRSLLFERAEHLGLHQPLLKVLTLAEQLWGPTAATPTSSWALTAMLPSHSCYRGWITSAAKAQFYCQAHLLRMPLSLLLPHLMRKAVTRYAKA